MLSQVIQGLRYALKIIGSCQRRADADFFAEVRAILAQARHKAYGTVNAAMVEAYWHIGRHIVEQEQRGKQRAGYGKSLIKELSKQLSREFGAGFAIANLWNFRQFYLTFPSDGKLYALRRELTWTHYRQIMRVESPSAREYYAREAAEQNWSTRQLERNIRTLFYERLLSTQDNAALAAEASVDMHTARDFIKDPYVLEFLDIPEAVDVNEPELETSIIDNLQSFLLELGKGFSFVARQMRVSTETSRLVHQDIGQMDMYVRMFDDLKRGEDDNPALGVILCANKDETMVRYSVLHGTRVNTSWSRIDSILKRTSSLRNPPPGGTPDGYDLTVARSIPDPAALVSLIWRLRDRISGYAPSIRDDDAAVHTLWQLGVRHLARPHESARVLPPRDLLIALVTSKDERVEMALVPLFLHTPSLSGHVEAAARQLERRHGLPQHATQLRLYYQAAAYLQHEPGTFTGEPLPDLYSQRLSGPPVKNVAADKAAIDIALRTLTRTNARLTHDPTVNAARIKWDNTYRQQIEVYRFYAKDPAAPVDVSLPPAA